MLYEVITLIEQLVYGQVERIHHPVLAFIHNPERFSLVVEQLCRAIVAANRMSQHEALIVIQSYNFV